MQTLMTNSTNKVTLVEVGPRDGLQNEPAPLSTEIKVEFIDKLSATGLPVIEATSFVSQKRIPQLADAEEVYAQIARHKDVKYPVLVPNVQGFERARAVGVKTIAVFTAASETFSQKNTNCSIDVSLQRLTDVAALCKEHDIKMRGYISCCLGCPYEGEIALDAVVSVAERLHALGCYEISLGDTIGVGTPTKARALFEAVSQSVPTPQLAGHFHDTYGQAIANIYAALESGVRTFDASVSGLGGCPYAPGATGNVATEDVVYLLEGLGLDCGVDLQKLADVGMWVSTQLNRPNLSKVGNAIK
jgi:hydroxymethylglutaryl-CoA lyase